MYKKNEGILVADNLLQNYISLGANLKNKSALDFGCSWGYTCIRGLDLGAKSFVGVDIEPHWRSLDDPSVLHKDGLTLLSGDLLGIPEIQDMSFDLIFSSGTLFLLDSLYLDCVLEWFCKHLTPGGEAFLRTRCVTAKSYNDLGTRLDHLGGVQFLLSRRYINTILNNNGISDFKSHLGYTGSTWIMACHGAGFEVVDIRRHSNKDVVKSCEENRLRTKWINTKEVNTGEITLHLRKPLEKVDFSLYRKQN